MLVTLRNENNVQTFDVSEDTGVVALLHNVYCFLAATFVSNFFSKVTDYAVKAKTSINSLP